MEESPAAESHTPSRTTAAEATTRPGEAFSTSYRLPVAARGWDVCYDAEFLDEVKSVTLRFIPSGR